MLDAAQAYLHSVPGQKLSEEERVAKTILLASLILEAANQRMSKQEKAFQVELAALMQDFCGRVFATELTDQAFRSQSNLRAAQQIHYLLQKYGVPAAFHARKRWGMQVLKIVSPLLTAFAVPLIKKQIRKETHRVILPGESDALKWHLEERRKAGIGTNLNHLGEAILGEEEAENRLQTYLKDLSKPEVECISVKISTLCSQLNLLAWEETLELLAVRFRRLLQLAHALKFTRRDGKALSKSVNLDMEEYKDLHLTVALFKKVLSEPDFLPVSAGLALQSYIPDAYQVQRELTAWAMERMQAGGAPIKIRIVKGANLAMEKVEAALKRWPQAPYTSKMETDENFKRMIEYALHSEHMQAVRIGVGSHNLFDLSYALILSIERHIAADLTIEMLEGMAEHIRRALQPLTQHMLLYCPTASQAEFQNAVAYLIRRLDENTGPENFLRYSFGLTTLSPAWQDQNARFAHACLHQKEAPMQPRRQQNRLNVPQDLKPEAAFDNEPDTDWSLQQNRLWIKQIMRTWRSETLIPAVIASKERVEPAQNIGTKPYQITALTAADVETCLQAACTGLPIHAPLSQRVPLLQHIASALRKGRGRLIAAMVEDTDKAVTEADVEASEAVDFAEYYARILQEIQAHSDLTFSPKGVIFVATPWNFPCSIPAGGIIAALACGNHVIFKPAPEAILVGYELAKLFWEAGVSKQELQFVPCEDALASTFVQDVRVNGVVLTGATATALKLLKLRPGLDLMAETGGKNSIIVTALADRDLAIRDIVQSAFGYAGQKCSACSLLILEEEVYEDALFRAHLKDAVASLKVGVAADFGAKITPLIRVPQNALKKALLTLEPGEEWLLKPQLDAHHPRLLSPGIKWGVRPGSFTHMHELFGPLLAVMKAKDLNEAIAIANATPYGLTAGLHSLDEREHAVWLQAIQAGNCYINRGITGAIVGRQPFGGMKKSSFGPGAKVGGPNYLFQMMHAKQKTWPREESALPKDLELLFTKVKNVGLSEEDTHLLNASLRSYSFYWTHFFGKDCDPQKLLGQDNIQRYVPRHDMHVRIDASDSWLDLVRIAAAAKITGACVTFSLPLDFDLKSGLDADIFREDAAAFIARISQKDYIKVRLLKYPSAYLEEKLSELGVWTLPAPVLVNGRIELLHYVRELSISYDYHRYGYLGAREHELRRL